METSFIHNPQRDAWKAIRGFLYQIELTVIRWLNLEKDAVLYCECGEDIDHVRELLGADSNSQERLLEQVKVRKRITLRSEEAIIAFATFHQAVVENSSIRIFFRFTTTATIGTEQGAKFPRSLPGIEAWKAIQKNLFAKKEKQEFIKLLKTFIAQATCPRGLQESVFRQFQRYVASASAKVLANEFVSRFEWATELPQPQRLHREIQSLLLKESRAQSIQEAQFLAEALTVYVLRLLTAKGEKRLSSANLAFVLQERSVTELDRRLLGSLVSFTERAETYLSHISSQVESVSQRVVALQGVPSQLDQLLQQFSGGAIQLLPTQLPSPDEPPRLPLICSKRRELVQALFTDLSKATWLAIVGATGMGKTFIARLVAEEWKQTSTVWISLRGEQSSEEASHHLELHLLRIASAPDHLNLASVYFMGALSFSQLAKQAALRFGSGVLVVIDEIPDLLKIPELRDKLVELAKALSEAGSRLLTTAQRHLSPSIKGYFDVAFVEKQTLPMVIEEVQEMVIAAGAPPPFLNAQFLNFLCGVTHGHPSLIGATVSFLRSNAWNISDGEISKLLTGDPTGEIRNETRRKVLHLLPNEQLRALLYRLSLINSSFGTTLLRAVANVPPSIAHSTDLLLELTGPWIHRIEENQFEVSPLLSGTGTDTLDPEVQKSVHKVVGLHYLHEKTLNPLQAVQLISHLLAASEWSILVSVLLRLASQVNEKSHAEAFDLFAFSFSSFWPEDMPLKTRIAFRMIQIRILTLLGKDSQQCNEELEVLIQNADVEALPAAFGALLLTGPLNPAADPLMATRRALQAYRLYSNLPEQIQHIPPEKSPAALIWASLTKVKVRSDLRAILSVLREMTAEERQSSFSQDAFRETAETFIAKCWSLELTETESERRWEDALSFLEEARQVAHLPGGEALKAPVARAQAIVLAAHLERPQEALTIINNALPDSDSHSRCLLHYTAGCILLDYSTPEAAFERYQLAFDEPPIPGSFLYFDALRRGAEAAGRSNQWQACQQLSLKATKYFRSREVFSDSSEEGAPLDSIFTVEDPLQANEYSLEMLGELAWAYWMLDEREKAWGAMAGIVRKLVQSQDFENRRFREVFAKTGHALGWMAAMAKSGKPPAQTVDGQVYTEPFAGFFSRPRPQLAELLLSPLFPVLFSQLAMFADGCELYELAWCSLNRANQLAEEQGLLVLKYVNQLSLAELAVRQERYREALQLAIPGIHAALVSRLSQDSKFHILTAQFSPEDVWKDLPEEQRRSAEHGLYWIVICRSIVRLFAKDVSLDSFAVVIAELETIFRQSEHEIVDLQYWFDTFRELRLAFSPLATRETILEQIRNLPAGDVVRLLPFYLALSCLPEVHPAYSCGSQSVTFSYLIQALPVSKPMLEDVSIYILNYWRRVAETQAFMLSNPQTFRKALQLIEHPTFSNVATLLLLAADATGAQLDDELRQSLTDATRSSAQ